jgi:outer membrane protein OmpA-like peptidoglycan-associated protein
MKEEVMLLHKNMFFLAFIFTSAFNLNVVQAVPDMPGSKDHPMIPRVVGTTILGYAESGYDEGVFMTGMTTKEILSENIEGKRTRILYMGPTDLSPLGALRNYQKAFADLGEVEEVYSCKDRDCFKNLGDFTWRVSNRIPTIFKKDSRLLFNYHADYKDQLYWYGKVTTPEAHFHVAVYAAVITEHAGSRVKETHNHPLINFEVVEVTDFKPTLEEIKAGDMTSKISEKGHIALYGIHFDFDSAVLKAESDPALKEIAKALKADTALNIYVAGHTDNKGTLEYNEDLSTRRAQAVAKALISQYGITNERVVPIGIGPAAPVATNKTEEGRTLNRRVELVER